MRRRPLVLIACALALSVSLFGTPAAASAARASNGTDPTETAKPLVTRFFKLVQAGDKAGLQKFVSPAFQLERADGSGSNKSDYLANLPTVQSFELTDFAASRSGSVLVVRYLAEATGVVNGKPYSPGPAPRLSVFARNGDRWQIVAHANFNPLNG
jgi:ketosteroid isomerase-like protein